MVRVTDKDYYMDDRLISKLDLMIKRCSGNNKMDNWIVIDGDEGLGKSTMSVCCAYYMAHKLNRKFSCEQIFFDPDKFIEYGTKTKEQVFILDESVFGGLSGDAMTKIGKKLIKFAMIIRKKRHVIFLNIPKFFKLNEYLMVDRSIALIHVYARGGTQLGRFVYFTNTGKEKLFYGYHKTKTRKYKTLYSFRGTFPNALDLLINEQEYDRKKDEAILEFGAIEEEKKKETSYGKVENWEETKERLGIECSRKEDARVNMMSEPTYLKHLKKYIKNKEKRTNIIITRDSTEKKIKTEVNQLVSPSQ